MKIFRIVFSASLALLLILPQARALDRQKAFVLEVLSGDTIRLRGGKMLRYDGIEAPPLQHKSPDIRSMGEKAMLYNASLVAGQAISIEWGSQLRDSAGRLLGYVFLENGKMVNLELIETGNAKARVLAPNLKWSKQLHEAQKIARRKKLGVWQLEEIGSASTHEYVGEKNTKVFYFSDSPELSIIPQANLVPFRSRVEAIAAGYRACSTCKESTQTDQGTLY